MTHPLSRRQLLRGLGLVSLAGLGCGRTRTATTPAADASPAAAPLTPTLAIPDDDEPPPLACAPTADNIEGPFFKAGAPHRAQLADARTGGVAMYLAGRVLGADCRALAGATLDVWQADARGAYDLRGWNLRGRLTTDAHGAWSVSSILPGRYLNGSRYRPRHVHLKLTAPGHRALTTQLYFPGDEYNAGDPWFDPSLLIAADGPSRDTPGFWGRYDLILAAA